MEIKQNIKFVQANNTPSQIETGEARFKSIINNHFDGVLIVNQAGVIRYANPMAEEMLGRSVEELVNFPPGLLIINGETTELDLFNKSGRRVVVELRTTETTWDEEAVLLVSLHDVTGRKEIEEKIFLQSKLLEGILNSISSNNVVIDRTGTIIFTNNAWNNFALQQGATLAQTGPGVNYLEVCQRALNQISVVKDIEVGITGVLNRTLPSFSYEYNLKLPGNNSWYQMQVDPLPVEIGGAVISHSDITDRKLAEQTLKRNEERLRLAVSSANIDIFDLDISSGRGVIDYQYDQMPGSTAFTEGADILESLEQMVHPEDLPGLQQVLNNTLNGTSAEYRTEYRLKTPQDQWRWVLSFGKLVEFDSNAKPARLIGTNIDITPLKLSQQRIQKLSNLYSTLSQTNQAIIRLQDRQALFDEICQIAINNNSLEMGWIGIVDEAEEFIVPCASFGHSETYLKNIRVTINPDDPRSYGPTGTAFRERQHYVCNDFLNDPRTQPWRDAAKIYGFRASAGFPLLENGQAKGVLTLYSGEVGYFDEEIVGLLDEMAMDISMALDRFAYEKQRAEMVRNLQESEERLHRAIVEAPFPIMLHAEGGEVIQLSKAWTELTGYQPSEITTTYQWIEKAYREKAPEFQERMNENYYQTERFHAGEFLIYTSDGGTRTWDFSATPLGKLPDGRRTQLTMAVDITERKQNEEALRRRESEFRVLVENSPDMISRVDRDLRFIYANPAISRFSAPYPENTSIDQLGQINETWNLIGDLARKVIVFRQSQTVDYETVIMDNRYYFQTEIVPELNTDNQVETLLLITRDLTSLKRAQEEQLSESRFKALFELSPDAVGLFDLSNRLVNMNLAMAQLTGYQHSEMLGKSFEDLDLITHDQSLEMEQQLLQSISDGTPSVVEFKLLRPDGQQLIVETRTQIVRMRDQAFSLSAFRDITQHKQLEAELRQAFEKQRELTDLKSRFISMASHDFRTPMATIQAASEALTNYLDRMRPEQIRRRLDKIQEQIRFMVSLLDDVLILGRIQSEKISYQPESLDLIDFIEGIFEETREIDKAAHKMVLLKPNISLFCQFDPKIIRQVLNNLLSNAVKYSGHDTTVTFEILPSDAIVTFTISDQGMGIPEKDQKNLFEPFHRGGNTNDIPGTGLGLSIARNLIELHNGTISFISEEGQGTTFVLTLPYQPA